MKLRCSAALIILLLASAQVMASDKPSLVTATEVVTQQLLQEVPLSGSAEPLQTSEVSTRVAGVVKQVLVEEGDWIEQGQQILALDPVIAELEVASANARLREAVARHKDALRRKKEFQSLIATKAVASTSLASAVADEEAALANIALQRAELKNHEELLSRHVLTAPFSGIVANKHVEIGQWVKAEDSVIKLVALDRIRVRASLPQRYFKQVDTDAPVRIVFDSIPGKSFSGKPSAVLAVGNQSTRSFPLLVTLENNEHVIAAGMSARVFVELQASQAEVLMIPRDAVVLKADGSRVAWQVTGSGDELKAKPVGLITGRTQGKLVEIYDSTLKVGDRVVLLGNENLRPGQGITLSANDSGN